MVNFITNRVHATSPTGIKVPDGTEIRVEFKTKIKWNFHEMFDTSQVKISQNYRELDDWLQWIIKEYSLEDKQKWDRKAFKYLEIGSYAGESLYYVAQVLPRGSTMVLVDLGDNGVARNNLYNVMEYVIREFNHYVVLVSGDSTDPSTRTRVTDIEPSFDLTFIDGNHTFDIASSDYRTFGPLSNRVAFHDISRDNIERDKVKYPPHGQPLVSHLWQGIKDTIKQQTGISESYTDKTTGEFVTKPLTIDNWLEIVDNATGLKPRGFGIIYGGKFG